ncbi:hypothetical protein HPB50_028481 [Hyalomma asiaticum]|nr:hypothetical protein HPB50_028481 [Hyalomma asiaticum]
MKNGAASNKENGDARRATEAQRRADATEDRRCLGASSRNRIAEMKEELEALAKEMKQLDALIEPHVCDEDLAEEYGGVRKNQGLITRMRTRLERLQRKSITDTIVQRPHRTTHAAIKSANVKALDDVNALRRLYDHIQRKSRWAENLGVQPDSYGAMLCAALFRVLPTEWAVQFHNLTQRTMMSVQLDSRFHPRLHSLEVESEKPPGYMRGKGSAASLKVGVKWDKERCPLCESESHDATLCDAVISAIHLREDRNATTLNGFAEQPHEKLSSAANGASSQRSFVTEFISRQMNLEVIGEEGYNLPVRGSWKRDEEQATTHAALPPARNDREDIDILIGADSYWSVVTGRSDFADGLGSVLLIGDRPAHQCCRSASSLLGAGEPRDFNEGRPDG